MVLNAVFFLRLSIPAHPCPPLPTSASCSIQEYADQIWGLVPARRPHPTETEVGGITR
jgi:hypothetical protein